MLGESKLVGMMDFETVSVDDVPADAPILDVREDYEFDAGHPVGALHIPLDQLPERLHELDPDTDYYVICRTGGRSAKATEFLEAQGYSAINIAGGNGAWLEAGKPLESADGSEPIIR